jgi:hypothetical protein
MRFNLVASQAEILLTTVWIALEKHAIASPKIAVLSSGTKLEIELTFASRRDEDLIKAELSLPIAGISEIRAASRSPARCQAPRATRTTRNGRWVARRLAV